VATTQPVALATPSQLVLATFQSHLPPTPRFRQLHQQPCQPSQPRSSEPAWSPPSCKGRLSSSRKGINLLASPGSPLVWQSVTEMWHLRLWSVSSGAM
jgi:hypothetical protein